MVRLIFLYYIALRKNLEKWPIFYQNHGLTVLEKSQFFDSLIGRFYSPERRLYFLEYRETHFLAYLASNKKMEIFLYFKREQQVQ